MQVNQEKLILLKKQKKKQTSDLRLKKIIEL